MHTHYIESTLNRYIEKAMQTSPIQHGRKDYARTQDTLISDIQQSMACYYKALSSLVREPSEAVCELSPAAGSSGSQLMYTWGLSDVWVEWDHWGRREEGGECSTVPP